MAALFSRSRAGSTRLKVGYIDTLFTRPLVRDIESLRGRADSHAFTFPDLDKAFSEGQVDVALLPSHAIFNHPECSIVPNVCVGSFGPTRIALLCSKVIPTEIQRVLVDIHALPLEKLLGVALPRLLMIRPHLVASLVPLNPAEFAFDSNPHDAFLLTGPFAAQIPPERFVWTWDLNQAWQSLCRMPFVLYVWAVRPEVDLRGLETDLAQLRYLNQTHLDAIADELAGEIQVDRNVVQKFYANSLHYTLDNVFLAGLRQFGKELADARLVEGNPPIRLYRPPGGGVAR